MKQRTYNEIIEKCIWNDKKSIDIIKNPIVSEHQRRRLTRLIRHVELLQESKKNINYNGNDK